jgi:hypothetical protein
MRRSPLAPFRNIGLNLESFTDPHTVIMKDMVFWVLRKVFSQSAVPGAWTSPNVFGDTDYDALTETRSDSPGGSQYKLDPPHYIKFKTGLTKLSTLDGLHTNSFFYDAGGNARRIYVGNITGDKYFDYEDKHYIFAKVDTDGTSQLIAFDSPRSASTSPSLTFMIGWLTGTLDLTGYVFKSDAQGRVILDEYGRLIPY